MNVTIHRVTTETILRVLSDAIKDKTAFELIAPPSIKRTRPATWGRIAGRRLWAVTLDDQDELFGLYDGQSDL